MDDLDLDCSDLRDFEVVRYRINRRLAISFSADLIRYARRLEVERALRADNDISALSPRHARITLLVLAITMDMNRALLPDVLNGNPGILADARMASNWAWGFLSLYS